MSLNDAPNAVRFHIAILGKRNSGKSSIINAITNQNAAIVSDVKGTTTDPVYKSIEILPIGPCTLIDTAGYDDDSNLGNLRVKKTMDVLDKTNLALLVIDGHTGFSNEDMTVLNKVKSKKIKTVIAVNKSDISIWNNEEIEKLKSETNCDVVLISALKKDGINKLKDAVIKACPNENEKFKIVGDILTPGDIAVLVTPIDKAAPKGRLILPQQQTIRDILESDCMAVVTKEFELRNTLSSLSKKPKIVITDSQVFLKVAADTPRDILMTSFSILFARFKGDLPELVRGALAINKLKDNDKVLIAEACTHHRQSDDIGTVKIPRWIKERTGKDIKFEFSSGQSFTEDIKKYSLIVHCGACMLNRQGMINRIETAKMFNVPIVNYGILIAYIHGILKRALEPFPLAKMIYEEESGDTN